MNDKTDIILAALQVALCNQVIILKHIKSDEQPTVEAESVKGWISVKERLPENDGEYIVWCRGKLEICDFDAESQTFGYIYDDYDEMYSHLVCWDDLKGVTHWMSLPELPKEE